MTKVYHPDPRNQAYKLTLPTDTSTKWVKAGRWNHIHANSSGHVINWDFLLCMATAGAVVLDAHTGGAKQTSPGHIHDNQDDMSGGIGADDVRVSWKRGWGEYLYEPDWYDWNDVIYAVHVQRRCALIGGDYSKVPYEFQIEKGGDFDHAFVLEDYRTTDSGLRTLDTLDTNFVWRPQRAYRAAAEALALRVRGTKSRLFVAFSRSRPLLETEPLYRVQIVASIPLYDKPYGSVKGHVTTATYTCTRHKVNAQWWYQIVPTAKTSNRGLWISPSRRTKVTYV